MGIYKCIYSYNQWKVLLISAFGNVHFELSLILDFRKALHFTGTSVMWNKSKRKIKPLTYLRSHL